MRFIVFLIIVCSQPLWADDMRPASLTITAAGGSNFNIVWQLPIKAGKRPRLEVAFDTYTAQLGPKRSRQLNGNYIESWTIKREQGLYGLRINIEGMKGSSNEVILCIVESQQKTITAILNTDKPSYTIPKIQAVTATDTVIAYTILGIGHILVGFDHLLFVACLVYISGTRKKLLLTITGFTVAHSITLILAATETLVVPIAPVEAVIALSIVFLAMEIAKNNRQSLSLKYPVLVSSSFGLLHGFGFASVLADIGLPETEKLLALLSFNIGVEIGQLIFVVGLFFIFLFFSKLYRPLTKEKLRFPASYLCGSMATIWMFERLSTF